MPKCLPFRDIISGLLTSVGTAVRYWFHYTLVAIAWLGVVPLTACRIYRCLFTGSLSALLTLPLDMLSTENLLSDSFHGCFVVTCTLCAFISLVWLREQILHGGGPNWLEEDNAPLENNNLDVPDARHLVEHQVPNVAAEAPAAPVPGGVVDAGFAGEQPNEPNAVAQDDNWNPIEWDRAAEELTWERLLGLDGSLVFLEHVFWVVSLNTLFIFVFAFCPYHIGQFTVMGFKIKEQVTTSHFEGLVTTLCGYVVIGLSLVFLHAVASLGKFKRSKRILGFCYIVVKVSLLTVIEVGVFPLVCGWWLDVCTLSLFNATLKDREASFKTAPSTSMFIHWLVGMLCVFYFASFILLLRKILRPGVLWFLRNLNDPDFNPIQEMIQLPLLRHTRRFVASMVILGTIILVMVWIPTRVIKNIWPDFLPYHVSFSSDTPVSELSLELVLLQFILPALLEQAHTRLCLRAVIRAWCVAIAWFLDLRSYLLGDAPSASGTAAAGPAQDNDEAGHANDPPAEQVPAANADFHRQPLGAEHQALLHGGAGQNVYHPYRRPKFFPLRIFILLVAMCASLSVGSIVTLTLPVFLGRKLMTIWTGEAKIHELYTVAWGLYTCWVMIRIMIIVASWIPLGWNAISARLKRWTLMVLKMLVAMSVIGIIPLMLGLLCELILVIPLRVPLHQTPVSFVWQDLVLGILHAKIICAVTLMGPSWWLKRIIEEVYQDGLHNVNLRFIMRHLAAPVVVVLGLALSVPYVIANSLVPMFGATPETINLVKRRIYPAFLAILILVGVFIFQMKQFRRLYEHIKNDKYLVGRRLVNYDHKPRSFGFHSQRSSAGPIAPPMDAQ